MPALNEESASVVKKLVSKSRSCHAFGILREEGQLHTVAYNWPIPPCFPSPSQGICEVEQWTQGIQVSVCRHQPNLELPEHSHANFTLVCILSGHLEESCYGRTNVYEAGDVIAKPPGYSHRNRYAQSGVHAVYLEITSAARQRMPQFASLFRDEHYLREAGLFDVNEALARRLSCSPGLKEAQLIDATEEILGMAQGMARVCQKPIDWLERLRLSLHDGFVQQQDLEELAVSAGRHPVHVAREFQRRFGTNIGQYLRRLRLAYAIGLLLHTDLPLRDVAAEAGFADQPHLTRLCKKHIGATPSLVRGHALRQSRNPSLR